MDRQQIEDCLRAELVHGIGFENSTYNKAPEWRKAAFEKSLRHVYPGPTIDVQARWASFQHGIAAAQARIASTLLEGVQS